MKWDICLTLNRDIQAKQKILKIFINCFITSFNLIFNKVDHDEKLDVLNFLLKPVINFLSDEKIGLAYIITKTYQII
jgi:hypothetical protein